jgi:hypothetical protein
MNPSRQLPQVVQDAVQTLRRPRQLRSRLSRVGKLRGLRSSQLQHQRHQPLLDAVVQIALDPAAALIRGGDDPRA